MSFNYITVAFCNGQTFTGGMLATEQPIQNIDSKNYRCLEARVDRLRAWYSIPWHFFVFRVINECCSHCYHKKHPFFLIHGGSPCGPRRGSRRGFRRGCSSYFLDWKNTYSQNLNCHILSTYPIATRFCAKNLAWKSRCQNPKVPFLCNPEAQTITLCLHSSL